MRTERIGTWRAGRAGRAAQSSGVRAAALIGAIAVGATLSGCVVAIGNAGRNGGVRWSDQESYRVPGTVEQEFAYDGLGGVDVDTGSGDIEVTAGEGRGPTLHVRAEFKAATEEERDAVEIVAERRPDGVLAVRVLNPDRASAHQRMYVTRLVVEGPHEIGRVLADTGSGGITIRGGVNPAVGRGGATVADTGSGNVLIEGHAGPIVADTGSGNVTVLGPTGEVWVDTGSGRVRIERTSGAFHADTGSGDVSVALAPGFRGWLEADTGSGKVRSVLPSMPDRTGTRCSANTGSGNVSVGWAE